MKCPACGYNNAAGAKQCARCKDPLTTQAGNPRSAPPRLTRPSPSSPSGSAPVQSNTPVPQPRPVRPPAVQSPTAPPQQVLVYSPGAGDIEGVVSQYGESTKQRPNMLPRFIWTFLVTTYDQSGNSRTVPVQMEGPEPNGIIRDGHTIVIPASEIANSRPGDALKPNRIYNRTT